MKRLDMPQRKGKPAKDAVGKSSSADAAFDVWLNRGLHEMFDDVVREPIPDALLKLVEEDRNKE